MSRRDILGVTFASPDPYIASVAHEHRVELGLVREFPNWEPAPVLTSPWPVAHPSEPTPIYDQLQRERSAR